MCVSTALVTKIVFFLAVFRRSSSRAWSGRDADRRAGAAADAACCCLGQTTARARAGGGDGLGGCWEQTTGSRVAGCSARGVVCQNRFQVSTTRLRVTSCVQQTMSTAATSLPAFAPQRLLVRQLCLGKAWWLGSELVASKLESLLLKYFLTHSCADHDLACPTPAFRPRRSHDTTSSFSGIWYVAASHSGA